MKTVGEIIRSERLKKEISLEKLSHLTKIDIKYLEAVEKNAFHLLPSETFAKGFIRNISLRLDRNPEELVAIFRRDYKQEDHTISPKTKSSPRNKISFDPSQHLPFVVGILVFLVYLGFQFRAVLTPPELTLQEPEPNSVVSSPFEVSGITTVDSSVSVGDDVKIKPDEKGVFSAKISLPLGETELTIKATNRFGRTTTKKINITIISK